MCGRKSLTKGKLEIIEELLVDEWLMDDYDPRPEIFPTNFSPILVENEGKRIVKPMHWGLIPSWSKDKKYASRMINARSETLEEKPSYRNLLNTSRCIIIADGFYEWKVENGIKRKYFIRKEDNSILAMAGLWTSWNSPNGAWINSYTVITSAAKGIISEVHDRMPVLLNKPCQDKWLIKSQEYHTSLLKPEVSGLVLNYAD
tara:strand:- start:5433 stop:6038 length:606 start_codon:yes stop_codon:yes gene_type:complete